MNEKGFWFLAWIGLVFFLSQSKSAASLEVLTEGNLNSISTKGGVWFIKFYAPWCGWCKNLAPIWEEFALTEEENKDLHVAKIDCDIESAICKAFKIDGFPTLKLIKNGEIYEYPGNGKRTVAAFKEFVKQDKISGEKDDLAKVLQQSTQIRKQIDEETGVNKDSPVADSFVDSQVVVLKDSNFSTSVASGVWFVKFYAPWCGHCTKLAPTWEKLAEESKGKFKVAKVDCTVEKETASKFGIRGYPTLKLIRNGIVHDYSGDRSISSLFAFATSGNPKSTGEPISTVGTLTLKNIEKEIFDFSRDHPYYSFASVAVFFTSIGFILGLALSPSGKKVVTVKVWEALPPSSSKSEKKTN